MKKKALGLTLALAVFLGTAALAAVSYPYGKDDYGKENIILKGNMSKSGIGVSSRPSIANRHDLRFKNVNNNTYLPVQGYLETVQYDIQPLPNEPPNKYEKISGYHILPLDQELIKDLATKANGNPEYVWMKINENAEKASKSPNKLYDHVFFYLVNNSPYVDVSAVSYFSGGGDPESIDAGGNGKTAPIFKTTYKSTNWPIIHELKQNPDRSIHIKASGSSIYETSVNGKIKVNDDLATRKQVFHKTGPVNNYTVTFEGNIPLSQLSGLKAGKNKITLDVGDTFGRTVSKSIVIDVPEQHNGCQPLFINYRKDEMPINLSSGAPGALVAVGGDVQWGLTYNKNTCQILEVTAHHENSNQGMQPSANVFATSLAHWSYEIRASNKGFVVKNTSQSENRPLIFYIGSKKYSINKGQTATVNAKTGDKMRFPSPLDESGFWKNVEGEWNGRKATKEYPSELKSVIEKLIKEGN